MTREEGRSSPGRKVVSCCRLFIISEGRNLIFDVFDEYQAGKSPPAFFVHAIEVAALLYGHSFESLLFLIHSLLRLRVPNSSREIAMLFPGNNADERKDDQPYPEDKNKFLTTGNCPMESLVELLYHRITMVAA